MTTVLNIKISKNYIVTLDISIAAIELYKHNFNRHDYV